jgi:hypothetical protein
MSYRVAAMIVAELGAFGKSAGRQPSGGGFLRRGQARAHVCTHFTTPPHQGEGDGGFYAVSGGASVKSAAWSSLVAD